MIGLLEKANRGLGCITPPAWMSSCALVGLGLLTMGMAIWQPNHPWWEHPRVYSGVLGYFLATEAWGRFKHEFPEGPDDD